MKKINIYALALFALNALGIFGTAHARFFWGGGRRYYSRPTRYRRRWGGRRWHPRYRYRYGYGSPGWYGYGGRGWGPGFGLGFYF